MRLKGEGSKGRANPQGEIPGKKARLEVRDITPCTSNQQVSPTASTRLTCCWPPQSICPTHSMVSATAPQPHPRPCLLLSLVPGKLLIHPSAQLSPGRGTDIHPPALCCHHDRDVPAGRMCSLTVVLGHRPGCLHAAGCHPQTLLPWRAASSTASTSHL